LPISTALNLPGFLITAALKIFASIVHASKNFKALSHLEESEISVNVIYLVHRIDLVSDLENFNLAIMNLSYVLCFLFCGL